MSIFWQTLLLLWQQIIVFQQEKKKQSEIKLGPSESPVPIMDSNETNKSQSLRKKAIMKGTQTQLLKSFSSASVEVVYERGMAGTGQPTVHYSKLDFNPAHMFALGSPIGLFTTVRYVIARA